MYDLESELHFVSRS